VADIKKEKQNAKKTIVWKDLISGEASMEVDLD
jgi:hypothetical protein